MCKRNSKMIVGLLLVIVMIATSIITPFQGVLAEYNSDGSKVIEKSNYYALPQTVNNYKTSGKILEFDLNFRMKSTDVLKFALYHEEDKNGAVSITFNLFDAGTGPKITCAALDSNWYHYCVTLSTLDYNDPSNIRSISLLRVIGKNVSPEPSGGILINNIVLNDDVSSLPEAYTEDFDNVTLADLGLAGTDYKTVISSGTYTYNGKSKTKSLIFSFGWDANIDPVDGTNDWKIALDTYWNANCMVWFQKDKIHLNPGQGIAKYDLHMQHSPAVTDGKHEVEFGRLRVVAGENHGKDMVFLKIDGEYIFKEYTDVYQTEGGYLAYDSVKTNPTYTICLVGDGVSAQGYSGFAEPDSFVNSIDYVNLGEIAPGGVIKDTLENNALGKVYTFNSKSTTKSTIVKYVLKTGEYEKDFDGSVYVVDIGGNCGFCRSYIPSGTKNQIMFGWEIEGCTSGTKNYTFNSNSWYAIEQGRVRIKEGINKGKDYVFIKINDVVVSSFYANPDSRPRLGNQIYVEAGYNFEIWGYNELRAKYYVDDELYLDQLAQKDLPPIEPAAPKKSGEHFVGWYTKKTGGELFDFKNTKLTQNIDLFARFTTDTVNATFNPNNGTEKTVVTLGKGCLIPKVADPVKTGGKYEQVFVGWKNDSTGEYLDFENDRISKSTTYTAQYQEKRYYVSYYANGKLVKKVGFVLSNPTVSGKEPEVPEIENATGAWEKHKTTGLTGNMTVNAVYSAKSTALSDDIKLNEFNGNKVYINTDTIHDYLSTAKSKQSAFVREFTSQIHDFQDYQNITFKWSDSGENTKYTVYFADNKDFDNAYIVTTKSKSLVNKVGIFVPGKKYYWYVAGDKTGKRSAIDTFNIVSTTPRYITAGKVTNMRDLGGYETEDGNKVKYGLVYRGASLDEFHSHIDDESRKVFNYLGMKSEIELRGGMEHDTTGWDENNPNVYNISASILVAMAGLNDSQKAQYKATFEAMADESNYPFYFHCSAGADRTGTFAYLLNGLLGVPLDRLREEYELTSFSEVGLRAADGYEYKADGSVSNSFDMFNDMLITNYGHGSTDVSVAIENYLKEYFGVSQSTLDSIKEIMLDKKPTPNDKPYNITVNVDGKKTVYKAYDGIYFMPEKPQVFGKLFRGFYNGTKKYDGYATGDVTLTAKFEDIEYETYDTITLKDLGIKSDKIKNQTNTVYTYKKFAKSGGRLFQFILEPIGDMNKGDGPQIAITNDWTTINKARIWLQSNTMSFAYHCDDIESMPDITKALALEPGKQYNVKFAVRVMKNKGYEGKKVFEVTVNNELFVQYIGCKADLSDNIIFFHGSTGAVYLINKPVYKTVNFYNGSKLIKTCKVERSGLIPNVKEPAAKNGLDFAGWSTTKDGSSLWDENTDKVYKNMDLYAYFSNVRRITADVDGKTYTYRVEKGDTLDSIPIPKKSGKLFAGWLVDGKVYTGKVTKNMSVTAKFDDYKYEAYDTITLKDLGITKDKIKNQTNTIYTYKKTAKSGGRLFQFILEPIGNMGGGDGPQIAFTNDWNENGYARIWLQSDVATHLYYKGGINTPPDKSVELALKSGQQYKVQISVRVLKNKGYEGKKVFEVKVNGKTLISYLGCKADLSNNMVYFHGATGAAYLINDPVYKTVKFYNGTKLIDTKKAERSGLIPSIKEPSAKNGVPFAGWSTTKDGKTRWDENSDKVYNNMSLYAYFADIKKVTANIDGKTYTYRVEVGKSINSLPMPEKANKLFAGWLVDGKIYNGKVTKDMTVTAKFENYKYEAYDTITLKDLGIKKNKIKNQTNTIYTYKKTAKSGGRVFRFILEPIGDMCSGDGPQIAFTSDWNKIGYARIWLQNNFSTHLYYKGGINTPPDKSVELSLEAGKKYNVEMSVRVLKNKNYKGKKVLEIKVDGKLLLRKFDCKADLSDNIVYFHGATGAAYLINDPVYKTVKFYNGSKLIETKKAERSGFIPKYKEPAPKNGVPFAGWSTTKDGKNLWDENSDKVYNNMRLYAYFADVKKITAKVNGRTLTYRVEKGKTLDEIPNPQVDGKLFTGWLVNGKVYTGKVTKNMTVTAKLENYKFEAYDTISLKDLGIKQNKIKNQTNTVYTYKKTAKSGGRVFKFILEPIGDMCGGDGPQVAFTNDWNKIGYARIWLQNNFSTHLYYKGGINTPPDKSVELSLEPGKKYDVEMSVRVLKNKGYEGKKVLEIKVDGKLLLRKFDCKADLSDNMVYFHGATGAVYLINKPVYKTVKFYNGNKLIGSYKTERSGLLPKVKEPAPQNGVPFAGWSTSPEGGKIWDENADLVYDNISVYAHFAYVNKVNAIVDGKELLYRIETGKSIKTIPIPEKNGKVFAGWIYNGAVFEGAVTQDMTVTAKFEDYQYEPYDIISLKDLGITQRKIKNQTNTVYTYEKTAKSGGRLFQFILEPIGDMCGGDGPQLALTENWQENSKARIWLQSNDFIRVYYNAEMDSFPTMSKEYKLEAGKQYKVEFAVLVLKNKGYEGKKVFEVKINGETIARYLGCKADLSENKIYFHGATGAAYLINDAVYKTVRCFNGSTLLGTYKVERSALLPNIAEPAPQNGLPFAGWSTKPEGGKIWDENADVVNGDLNLYAQFADVRIIKANVDGKILKYRVPVGKTLDVIPKPQKPGNVFAGWAVGGSIFTGKVVSDMDITAVFEAYSFDDYDEISLHDLGITGDLNFATFENFNATYTYLKAAKTGGRVFKAIYVPTKDMINGPQVSFSQLWDENYFAKLYFTKFDTLYVYSSGIVDGLPTFKMETDILGGKEYEFEIGVRVLNNKGYKGVKVLTVYLNGELIFEEFDNKANIDDATVFFQGLPDTGIFRNVDIYNTVSFYDGDNLLSSVKVLRGSTITSPGNLADKGDKLFAGWFTEYGIKWEFDTDCVYLNTVIKAKYTKRTYPVLLMVDGVLYKRINVCAGETVDLSDKPTKNGYEFDKWLNADGSEFDMKTAVNGPIILNASFKKSAELENTSQKGTDLPAEKNESDSSDLIYILFGVIGLVVIAAETGIIIYKKRSKR